MKKIFVALHFAFLVVFSVGEQNVLAAEVRFEEDFGLPVVYLNIVTDVGAAHDPDSKLGLATVANQMLLRGTENYGKLQFFELINQLGGRFDVEVRTEGTVYRAAVLSENLDKFLSLVEEAFLRPKFTLAELRKLKSEIEGVILDQKSNDKALVSYHYSRFLYGDHPYGNPTIGTRKGVSAITYKDVVDFYAKNFGANTLRLFGSGAVKTEKVEKWFENLTEKLGALHPSASSASNISEPQFPPKRRALIVDKAKATQAQVLLGGKGMRPELDGFYAVLLANHSFGGPSFQARMMQEIRVKRGWTYGASNSFRFGREPRHFGMYVFPKTSDTVPAISLMLEMFQTFIDNGITPAEFDFARQSLINNAPFNYDTPQKRLENATTEYLLRFPDHYFRDFADNIAKVRFEDIQPALKKVFDPRSLTLTVVGDAKDLKADISKLPGFGKPNVKDYRED